MKNKLMLFEDKRMLCKRSIIETIHDHDQLKNISQLEHTRHRSIANFIVNLRSGLIAYAPQAKKPSIGISQQHIQALTVAWLSRTQVWLIIYRRLAILLIFSVHMFIYFSLLPSEVLLEIPPSLLFVFTAG
jgi:hypothetical protein